MAISQTLIRDAQQTARTHEQIAERLRQLPGVQSVGLASSMTMDGIYFNGSILVEAFPETGARARQSRRHKFIAPGYFETMGKRVLAGRSITWTDIYQDALVVVVSESLARAYWANPADALGKRIRVSPNQPWREIVGIATDERDEGGGSQDVSQEQPLADDHRHRARRRCGARAQPGDARGAVRREPDGSHDVCGRLRSAGSRDAVGDIIFRRAAPRGSIP